MFHLPGPQRWPEAYRHGLCNLLLASVLLLAARLPAAADDIYVANYNSGTILRFNESGQSTTFASGLPGPVSLAYYGGSLYVGCQNYTITRLDANGNATLFYSAPNLQPQGMAFDAAGNLFVSSYADHRILELDPQAHMSVFATSGVYSPTGLAFDTAGNLYEANYYSGTIQRFDPNGNGTLFATPGTYPNGLTFDSQGNLFVSLVGPNQIWEYNSQGAGRLFASTGLNLPAGLDFDSNGGLLEVNRANPRVGGTQESIQLFDPLGNGTVFASSGLNGAMAVLTVTVVPEPGCGALLGLGALCLFWRGRTRTAHFRK